MKVEALIRRQPWPASCKELCVPLPYATSCGRSVSMRILDVPLPAAPVAIPHWRIRYEPAPLEVALESWIPFEAPSAALFHGIDRTVDAERLAGSRVAWRGGLWDTIDEAVKRVARLGPRHRSLLLLPKPMEAPRIYGTFLGPLEVEQSTFIQRGYVFTPSAWTNFDGVYVCTNPGANAVFAMRH